MPTFDLTIDGVSWPVEHASVSITRVMNGQGSMSCQVASLTGISRPVNRKEVILKRDGVTRFGGFLIEAREAQLGPDDDGLIFDLTCVDYNTFTQRWTVDETFHAGSLKSMLQTVIDNYLGNNGVTLDASQVDGPDLPEMPFVLTSLTDVLNDLSKAADGYMWRVDATKTLRMWAAGELTAPFNFTDASRRHLGDVFKTPTNNEEYATKVIMIVNGAGTQVSAETFTAADGVSSGGFTRFTTKYPAAGKTIGDAQTITWPNELIIDGVGQGPIAGPFGGPGDEGNPWNAFDQLISNGGLFAWAWDAPNHQLVYDEAAVGFAFPTGGQVISIAYQIGYPYTVEADSGAAPADEVVVTVEDNQARTGDGAQAIANGELAARNISTLTKVETSTADPGLEPGQRIHFDIAKRALDADCLISQITTTTDGAELYDAVTAYVGDRLSFADLYKKLSGGGGGGSASGVSPVGTGATGPAQPNRSNQYNRNGKFGGKDSWLFFEDQNSIIGGGLSSIDANDFESCQVWGYDNHIADA